MSEGASSQLLVLRCRSCGDTFTIHADDDPRCRSCGSEHVETAHEPLL